MKKRSDALGVSFLLVSILLTLVVFSVLGAEARDKFLNGSGEFIWHGWDGNDWEIFLYSKGIVTQITDNDYTDDLPWINSKGRIVWQGYDGNDYEIFLYSKGTVTQITDSDYDDCLVRPTYP